MENNLDNNNSSFTPNDFFKKLTKCFKFMGAELTYRALLLFITLQKPDIPAKTKAIITGALLYLISPLDAIPDIMGPVGFTDDIAIIGIALVQVSIYIDDDVRASAKAFLKNLFSLSDEELDKL